MPIVTRIMTYVNTVIPLLFFFYYLVVPFTEKFEPLGSLVHKNSIQVTRLHRADLYGFLTPAHNLIRMDISWKTRNRRKTDGEFCNQYSSALICNIQNGHKRSVIHRRISQAVEMKSPLGSMKVGEAYRQRWASLPTAAPRPWWSGRRCWRRRPRPRSTAAFPFHQSWAEPRWRAALPGSGSVPHAHTHTHTHDLEAFIKSARNNHQLSSLDRSATAWGVVNAAEFGWISSLVILWTLKVNTRSIRTSACLTHELSSALNSNSRAGENTHTDDLHTLKSCF